MRVKPSKNEIFEKLKSCEKCNLHKYRSNVVIGRGSIPADIVFLCEYPDSVSDIIGKPLLGKNKKMLEKIIVDSCNDCNLPAPSYYITNTVLCRPVEIDLDTKKLKSRQPVLSEVLKCKRNVMSIIRKVDPNTIIFLGKESEKYYYSDFRKYAKYHTMKLQHPNFVLKSGGVASPYYGTIVRLFSTIIKMITQSKKGI